MSDNIKRFSWAESGPYVESLSDEQRNRTVKRASSRLGEELFRTYETREAMLRMLYRQWKREPRADDWKPLDRRL